MASSKVELASSPSPFRYIQKDNHHREKRMELNSNLTPKNQSNFQRNLKMLVRDHFHSCISLSGKGSNIEAANDHCCLQSTGYGCWGSKSNIHSNNIHFKDDNNNINQASININREEKSSTMRKQQSEIHDQFVVQETEQMDTFKCHSISSRECISLKGPSPTSSDCDISVSSLVQMWRGIESEARLSSNNVNVDRNKGSSTSLTYDPTIITKDQQKEQHNQDDVVSLRGEQEGINVADMVKTWANTYQVTCNNRSSEEQQPSFRTCLSQLKTRMSVKEQTPISSPITYSNKLRGRQAIADLFMRMEKERYEELEFLTSHQAVTKFPQRGRIQSLMRLRILRRDASIQEQQPSFESNIAGSNQSQVTTTVHNLRERFGTTNYHNTIIKRNTNKESSNYTQDAKNGTASNQNFEEDADINRQDLASIEISCPNWDDENGITHDQDLANNQQRFENAIGWINDVARPRTHWEDCRQARYNEIFDSPSKYNEIRQLIERERVSSLLASDFRDRMDRLMMRSIKRVLHSTNNEEEQKLLSNNYLKEEQDNQNNTHVQTFQDTNMHVRTFQEENEDEELSSSFQQYQDASDYDQTPPSSHLPCDSDHEDEPSEENSDHTITASTQQPSPNLSYYCRTDSSLKNFSTIDVELLYDLRTHMQQLNQEMFELRKSIISCMDMQVKLQSSIKEQVSYSINNQIDQDKQNKSNGRKPKRGYCQFCYENKIDSLLYRCGHMCTCFNCANELRRSSGKCPICQAQIIDVVQAYCDI